MQLNGIQSWHINLALYFVIFIYCATLYLFRNEIVQISPGVIFLFTLIPVFVAHYYAEIMKKRVLAEEYRQNFNAILISVFLSSIVAISMVFV